MCPESPTLNHRKKIPPTSPLLDTTFRVAGFRAVEDYFVMNPST